MAPGIYTLRPETPQGVFVSPSERSVTVAYPVTGIDFSPARVSIRGRVHCIGSCDNHVRVTLSGAKEMTTHADGMRVRKRHHQMLHMILHCVF